MDNFKRAIEAVLQFILDLGNLIVAGIVAVELWARAQLTQFNVPPAIQTLLLIALAVLLIVGAFRLFGGLIRVVVILVLLLIAIHIIMPLVPH